MIEKSVFEKKINEGSKKQKNQQKAINHDMKKNKFLKDISNEFQCPQILTSFSDYKTLYQSQVEINQELREKIELLQQKVRLLQQQNKQLRNKKQQKSDDQIASLNYIHSNKKSKKQLFFEEIRSFKGNLPNSMRIIQLEDLNAFESIELANDEEIMSKLSIKIENGESSNNQKDKQKVKSSKYNLEKQMIQSSVTMKILNDDSLVDCLCLYGLSQEPKFNEQLQDSFFEGELTYCSKDPHQIVKHAASLMYPKRMKQNDMKIFQNDEAVQNAVNLVTQTLKSQLKAFTLIFQPAMLKVQDNEDQFDDDDFNDEKDIEIIDLVNKQKRFYAISLSFQDFDIVHQKKQQKMDFQNSLQQDIYNHKMKIHQNVEGDLEQNKIIKNRKSSQMKPSITHTLSNKKSQNQNQIQQKYKIRQSRKILTIFTKYPFMPFFQQLLVGLLKESFQLRKQAMRRNLSQLCNFQHSKTIEFVKIFYQKLNKQYRLSSKFEHKINEILEIKYLSGRMNRMESIFLELSKSQLRNYYSEIWAYPILRLFTLDSFLDTLTLILLEEKVIFVCQNEHVLTSTVFLFIKVLMQPFNYPYPVVSIIPNQYDYFNAPFPIVYGTINSRQNLIKEKIPKLYQNVYIILSPQGIQIISHKNYSSKIQSVKSPKLRDKLLPLFIKMENHQKQFNPPRQVKQPRFSGLSSFLGFKTISPQPNKQDLKFIFSNTNRQLAHQIIEKVFLYLNAIKQRLPQKQKVDQVRKQIQYEIKTKTFTGDLKNLDIDKQTYQRFKDKLSKKTQDPFIIKFLSTQIVGMQILK